MPERFRVLITDFLAETSVETPILGDIADLVTARAFDESELVDQLADADAMIVFHDVPMLTDATFARAERCRGAVRAGVGYNNIDLAAAGRNGIVVCNVPDYGTEEVADHSILLLLAVARRLIPCHDGIRQGEWHFQLARGTPRLRGKTLGIVGCGRIGSATALRAKARRAGCRFLRPLRRAGAG